MNNSLKGNAPYLKKRTTLNSEIGGQSYILLSSKKLYAFKTNRYQTLVTKKYIPKKSNSTKFY